MKRLVFVIIIWRSKPSTMCIDLPNAPVGASYAACALPLPRGLNKICNCELVAWANFVRVRIDGIEEPLSSRAIVDCDVPIFAANCP